MNLPDSVYVQSGLNSKSIWIWIESNFKEYIYPIITLLIGIWIKTVISSRSDKRHSAKIGKRWLAELSAQYADIEKQIIGFDAFIKEYCGNLNRFDIPNISYGFINSRNFDALGKEDLYDYLGQVLKQDVDATYRKITGIISSLEVIDIQYRNIIQQFQNRTSSLVKAYSDNLDQYGKLLRNISNEYSDKYDIIKSLNVAYTELCKGMPKINIFECEDSFIIPTLTILRENSFSSALDERLQNCLNITLSLRNEKNYIKIGFASINDHYRKILKSISEINEICRPKRTKFNEYWEKISSIQK